MKSINIDDVIVVPSSCECEYDAVSFYTRDGKQVALNNEAKASFVADDDTDEEAETDCIRPAEGDPLWVAWQVTGIYEEDESDWWNAVDWKLALWGLKLGKPTTFTNGDGGNEKAYTVEKDSGMKIHENVTEPEVKKLIAENRIRFDMVSIGYSGTHLGGESARYDIMAVISSEYCRRNRYKEIWSVEAYASDQFDDNKAVCARATADKLREYGYKMGEPTDPFTGDLEIVRL